MTDQKPPQFADDEATTLRRLLQYQRDSFVRKVEGVDEPAARRALVPSGTSLLWLTRHMARAEETWVLHRFGGHDLGPEVDAGRDTLDAAIAAYRAGWTKVDAVIDAAPGLDARCHATGVDVNLRWVLAHLLEETARHAGHADILRELIDGRTGR